MVYEEYKDLEGFDPTKMDDPIYAELVKQARQIKDNAIEIMTKGKPIQPNQEEIEILRKAEEIKARSGNISKPLNQQEAQKMKPERETINEIIYGKPAVTPTDLSVSEFINQEKLDQNSEIYKMSQQNIQLGQSQQINSMWMNKGQLKKYFSGKIYFNIKERNKDSFKKFRFQSVGSSDLERIREMSEDVSTFYQRMRLEQNFYEDRDGNKKLALLRNGNYYTSLAKLEMEYRKEIALICLGIDDVVFDTLEMLSDPEYTVKDIWGVYDVIDGILEKVTTGASYFRTASNG